MTQKWIIYKHLEQVGDWIPAYKLRSIKTSFGWLGHQADREARRMAAEGIILRRINGRYAEYRVEIKAKPKVIAVDKNTVKFVYN